MVATQFNSLERVFSRRELFRGKSLQALLWGVFASFALCLLLVDLFLICRTARDAGPAGRGERSPAIQRITSRTKFASIPNADGPKRGRACRRVGHRTASSRRRRDFGRPSCGSTTCPCWARCSPQAYRRISWFRENIKCLTLLVLIGVVIACAPRLVPVAGRRRSARASRSTRPPACGGRCTARHCDWARRLDRSGRDAGDRPVHQGGRPGSRRHSDVDLSPRLRSVPACLPAVAGALAVQWRVALQCLILLGGCWYLVQRQRLRFAAAEKLEESRADPACVSWPRGCGRRASSAATAWRISSTSTSSTISTSSARTCCMSSTCSTTCGWRWDSWCWPAWRPSSISSAARCCSPPRVSRRVAPLVFDRAA